MNTKEYTKSTALALPGHSRRLDLITTLLMRDLLGRSIEELKTGRVDANTVRRVEDVRRALEGIR